MTTPAEHAATVRRTLTKCGLSGRRAPDEAYAALLALVALAERATELERELREREAAVNVEHDSMVARYKREFTRAQQLETALRLRPLFAELDDYSLTLTDERIDELRDAIVDAARVALDGGTATPEPTA